MDAVQTKENPLAVTLTAFLLLVFIIISHHLNENSKSITILYTLLLDHC